MNKKFLVTAALPYVNNVPHLGNLIPILSGDVYARFKKVKGKNCIFVCGTDEHGTTTEIKAKEENITPRELVDKYFNLHKEIYSWFEFEIDCFGRTSDEKNHKISTEIFKKLYNNGFIIEKTLIQMWDEKEERFLSDRFIEGTCPYCDFEQARGDQCDSCGKLLDATDLKNPRSVISGSVPMEKESKHLFIDLGKIEHNKDLDEDLTAWIEKNKSGWSHNALSTTQAWIKNGLNPRCITRDLEWGIKVPAEELGLSEEYKNKVFYSWFDAPIGYISITANHTSIDGKNMELDWKNWWKNPEETKLVQFMGKDNIPFHCILFPAFCIGAKDNYTLMNQISVNEYLNYEAGKFSKSRHIGVFGDDAMTSGIPADVYRYYLTAMRPERDDTVFDWDGFQSKINKELLGNFGNLVNRIMTFITNNYDGIVYDSESISGLDEIFDNVRKLFESCNQKEALQKIMRISSEANIFFQESEPWVKVKEDKCATAEILAKLARRVKDLAIVLSPIMPSISKDILTQMNLDESWLSWDKIGKPLPDKHKLGSPKILFEKMEDDFIKGLKSKYGEKKQEKCLLNLKVAEVISVEKHPDADKLLVLKVDFGEERQLVAGLKEYYSPEELVGMKLVVITNLQTAKLRGVESQAMLLAGVKGDEVKVLSSDLEKGSQIQIKGTEINEEQISFDDFKKLKLKIKDSHVYLNGKKLEDVTSELESGKVY